MSSQKNAQVTDILFITTEREKKIIHALFFWCSDSEKPISLGCTKNPKQKKSREKRKSAAEEAQNSLEEEEEEEEEAKNGEHTIRPVALVGGVGVRLRRFCFIVIKIGGVKCVVVVEEVSLFEECDKKREEYVRR